uniref:Uncharacterized protein n=1 Tax=Anopheles epiroticus TaxID=199890 RepID=A0A182PWJ9_9DIPT
MVPAAAPADEVTGSGVASDYVMVASRKTQQRSHIAGEGVAGQHQIVLRQAQQQQPYAERQQNRGLGRKRPDVIIVTPASTAEKSYTYRDVYEKLQRSDMASNDKEKLRRGNRTRKNDLKLTLNRDTDAGALTVRIQEVLGECGTARLVTEMICGSNGMAFCAPASDCHEALRNT